MGELMALAGRMGVELPDELLECVAGGVVVEVGSNCYEVYKEQGPNCKTTYGFLGREDNKWDAIELANEHNASPFIISEADFITRKNYSSSSCI